MRLMLLALVLTALASAQQFTDLVIDAENSRVFGTLYPNENGSFVLVIDNAGDANADHILLTLESDSDLKLTPSVLQIGQLERKDKIALPISVEVGDVDPSRTHTILVNVNYSGVLYDPLSGYSFVSELWKTWTVPLNVSARMPIIRPALQSPNDIMPGDRFTLNVSLENIGEGDAKNVEIAVHPPEDVGSQRETVSKIFKLGRGERATASFDLFLSGEADGDIYNIPVDIRYTDLSERNAYGADTGASVNVIAPAALSISNLRITPSPLKINSPSTLSLRVENTGNGEAENIEAVLETASGTQRSLMGNLEEDEDTSVAFLLVPEDEGDFPAKIRLRYRDDLGEHEVAESLVLKAYDGDLTPYALPAAAILLALAALYVLLRGKK